MATRKDKQEALNYLAVLENIGNMMQGGFLREQDVLRLHRTLAKDTLENAGDCGVYRKRYVVVANKVTGEIFFNPPQNKDVPRLMKDLIEWINSEEAKELDPVIEAGIVHYEFVRIHPFVDGNGRAARVLAALILNQRGFDTKQFFCLDDYYDVDQNEYYQALQNVKQDTLDMTNWLEYFADGVHVSIEAVKERVVRLSSERLRKTPRGEQIALTERQMMIVEFINQNGSITNRTVQDMFKISDRAALKEIRKLVDLKVIKSKGKGRSLHYIFVE